MNSEPLHPFMKGLVAVLLLLIPVLGTLILRSDPVISSSRIAPDTRSIQTVQTFARFIQTKPELAKPSSILAPLQITNSENHPAIEPVTDGQRELIAHTYEAWQKPGITHDEEWRSGIEKMFYLAEVTGSLDALDLIHTQVLIARKDESDLNRSKADQWFERYLKLERRENKRKEAVDYFREAVQNSARETLAPSPN